MMWWREFRCWCWNKLHGYPRGSINEDGSIITLQTGRHADNWFYREYMKHKKEEE